jgi:hypothetical protein
MGIVASIFMGCVYVAVKNLIVRILSPSRCALGSVMIMQQLMRLLVVSYAIGNLVWSRGHRCG